MYDSCNSHLTDEVKNALYSSGVALAVIPRGMTLALQFLDLYFFAFFKRLYAEEIDKVLETKTEKLSASDKRIIMTDCVAAAWKTASDRLPIQRLFRELGYIWSREGADLKIPVLPKYRFDPVMMSPVIRVPLTPYEQAESLLMAKEDAFLQAVLSPPALTPAKKQKQATLSFGKK